MARVIVSGALANKYRNGGATWTRLNWALGFRQLGCDLFFVEQLEPAPTADGGVPSASHQAQISYFQDVVERFGLADKAALITPDGSHLWGLAPDTLHDLAAAADLLVNISGHLTWEPVKSACRRKVYIDLDPGYTQFWEATGIGGSRLDGHEFYFTVGANIGQSDCPIPTCGLAWRPIRQPVVLAEWPVAASDLENRSPWTFSTVASWRGPFGRVAHNGRSYGLKAHEFRKFIEIPQHVDRPFEVALDIDSAEENDLQLLAQNGWKVLDPQTAVGDPDRFREFIQASGAEFSPAQGVYVETNSGWFSDRTVRYLASGKPALVQETGFSRNLPSGEGLLAFNTFDEAVTRAGQIAADYPRHCHAARRLAEEYFASDKVLRSMMAEIGMPL